MLSQASQRGLDISGIGGWIVLLVAAAILLAVVVVAVKRWTFRGEESAVTAWTLHDLLTLRDSGELTIQQYEALRADLIRGVTETGAMDKSGRDGVTDRPETASQGDSVA